MSDEKKEENILTKETAVDMVGKITEDANAQTAVEVGIDVGKTVASAIVGLGGKAVLAGTAAAGIATLASNIGLGSVITAGAAATAVGTCLVAAPFVLGAAAAYAYYKLRKNKKKIDEALSQKGLNPKGKALDNGFAVANAQTNTTKSSDNLKNAAIVNGHVART